MIRAVVFDFDDTLIHTYENGLDYLKLIFQKMGKSIDEDHITQNWGKSWNEFFTSFLPIQEKENFERVFFSNLAQFKGSPPIRGVHEVIDILSKTFSLGILTGNKRELLMQKAIEAKIDIKRFDFILTSTEVPYDKSDPRYFSQVAAQFKTQGIAPHEILFVADSVYDVDVARNAGIHFAGVLTGPFNKEDLMEKGVEERMIIPSVMDLPELIRTNGFNLP